MLAVRGLEKRFTTEHGVVPGRARFVHEAPTIFSSAFSTAPRLTGEERSGEETNSLAGLNGPARAGYQGPNPQRLGR
jgi:hypothetical protein